MSSIQKLLVDNLNIWSAADTAKKSGRGRASSDACSAYGISKVRELILELAVRGKLVPQEPNDEPASELIKRIQSERAKLVAGGKTKNQKLHSAIAINEIKFSLPNNWSWVRLDEIAPMPLIDGDWIESKDQDPSGNVRLVQLADIGVGIFKDKSERYINQKTFERLNCSRLIAGDILIARLPNPIGRACIFPGLKQVAITVVDVAILRPCNELCSKYVISALNSKAFRDQVESFGKGATRFRVSTGNLKTLLFPMPPLSEQHRIVAKVDELMLLCDQIEEKHINAAEAHEKLVNHLLDTLIQLQNAEDFSECWQRIAAHFDMLFTTETSIDALKQTILQLAVMGKLVSQDPDDEPASVLIESILKERDRLIEYEGLKTTAGVCVKDCERYLPLPEHWQYCRLGNLAQFIDYRGKTPKKVTSGVRLITAKNVKYGYICPEPAEYITAFEYKTWMSRGFPRAGDILFTTEAPLGNVAIIDVLDEFALAQRVICFKLHDQSTASYIKIALMSGHVQHQLSIAATGMTATGIKASKLKEIPIPIPPLKEQQRIVAKVDELMAFCEQMKRKLLKIKLLQQKTADVMIEQCLV